MRSGRGLLVLVVLLGGLLAYLYFVDAKRPLADEEEKPKVFSVEADQIQALRVATVADEPAELKKEGDTWMLVSPVAAKADQSEVSSITSSLASLQIQRVVDEKPQDLGTYGLREPVVEIGFTTADSGEYRTLQLGNKTPTGSDMYAKVANEPRVFLVYGYLDSTFNRKPFDLRDKQLLTFERDKVDRLELQREGDDVTLTKASATWTIEAPVKARADFSTVEGLVSRLQSAQMTSIVTEEANVDLKKYGLDDPEATAIVGTGSSRATLLFGDKAESGDIYVRDTSRPGVFTVGADLLTEVQKPLADLRWKDIFEARTYNTSKIELTRDGTTTTFERQEGKGENGADLWTKAGAEGNADTTKVESFLTSLSGLRAQEFADRASGAKPVLTVRVTFGDDKKTEEVVFLRDGDRVYARRGSEPGLAVVETSPFDEAVKKLDEIK